MTEIFNGYAYSPEQEHIRRQYKTTIEKLQQKKFQDYIISEIDRNNSTMTSTRYRGKLIKGAPEVTVLELAVFLTGAFIPFGGSGEIFPDGAFTISVRTN